MDRTPLPAMILSLICLMLTASVAADDERERMTLSVKPAVVFIYSNIQVAISLQTEEGPKEFPAVDMSGAGSGFIVHPDGYIVTNGHVVKDFHSPDNTVLKQRAIIQVLEQHIFPQYVQQKRAPLTQEEMVGIYQQLLPYFQSRVLKQLYVFLSNWQRFSAEIKQYSPPITPIAGKSEGIISFQEEESGKDIAILKIEQSNLPTVRLGDSAAVRLQSQVFPAGYPGAVTEHNYLNQSTMLEASITSGHVSSLKLDVKGTPAIQFDAPVTWGNSGGPVFNRQGEVIGIATFISLRQTGPQSAIPIQGFNFAVPINTAKEFIRAAGFEPAPGHFDRLWGQALDLYFRQRHEALITKCDELLRLMPNQPDARLLQVRAQEYLLANPPTVFSRVVEYWWVLALVGVLLLVGVAGVAAVLLGGRARKAAAQPQVGVSAHLKATVADVSAGGRSVAGAALRVVCEKGPEAGRSWDLSDGLAFGRDPARCRVVIADDHVSKIHSTLTATPSGLILEDNGSTNGTFVNQVQGEGIKRATVKRGDRIILGNRQAAIFRIE